MTLSRYFSVLLLSGTVLVSCSEVENNHNEEIHRDTTIVRQEQTKTDEYIKAGKEGVELVKDIVKDKKRKDSIRVQNKAAFWVYQLGEAYTNEDLACKEIEKISSVPNIKIFKKDRHEYYIIKDDGLTTYEDYQEGFGEVKKSIQALSAIRVKIIDLSREHCSAKTKAVTGKPVKTKMNGEKTYIPCLICD